MVELGRWMRAAGLSLVVVGGCAVGQTAVLAPTPPMGWNSWDAYGTTVRESEVRATIDSMAAGLKPFGWEYVVVDIQWSEPNPKSHGYRVGAALTMDAHGRLTPAVNRFPSSANGAGFKALADYAHSKGLKFGIHIMRGIPREAVKANTPIEGSRFHAANVGNMASTCEWNTDMYGVDMTKPGAQDYYDSLARMYAGWGLDFIKADDMSRPYHQGEIEALHKAIAKTGRPMVLSLSPGPAPVAEVASLRENAQMWRIADDLWDNWASVKDMYFRMETWLPLVQVGGWPDADMLPLGHIGLRAERGEDRQSALTHDEQRTLMTLWCMQRSPLMFGGDVPSMDAWTRGLLTNAAVLEIDQHSSGGRVALQRGDVRVWTARGAGGVRYVSVTNLGDAPTEVAAGWQEVGLSGVRGDATELWTGAVTKGGREISGTLAPHASLLYRVNVAGTK